MEQEKVLAAACPDWHNISSEDCLTLLGTNDKHGLQQKVVAQRLVEFGSNIISARKENSIFIDFLLQFNQPLIYVLLVAGVVTALFQEWVDSSVIFGVILINAIVGFIQESKAKGAINALAKSLTSEAAVLRSGEKLYIPSSELVPGDIVFLQSGDKVPADLRLITTRDLQIDESALTGESIAAAKNSSVLPKSTSLPDRANMAYSSTLVNFGTATGVVTATGDLTQIGQISEMLASTTVLETPLMAKIRNFSHWLVLIILSLAALAFTIDILRGKDWLMTFKVAVALAIGAIPEGLPAAMTIMLAIGVSRMAKRNAIIRRLPAVETLGSVTVICSDKTGTLTKNQMTVQEIFAGDNFYYVKGVGYNPEGEVIPTSDSNDTNSIALKECLRAGILCCDSTLVNNDGLWSVQGDPTEGALVVSALKGGFNLKAEIESFPRIDTLPFESDHQYMATLHRTNSTGSTTIYIKGSLEAILSRSEKILLSDGTATAINHNDIIHQSDSMASKGLRVIALAKKVLSSNIQSVRHEDVENGLLFLGIQGMIDPPRPEAIRSIATCQKAGIRIKMITGDHAKTAIAIARKLKIQGLDSSDGTENVITGAQLNPLHDEALIDLADRTVVFARVSPEHKLRLVKALQAKGEVVAMTGDGVNDGPALRRADIGIAMALQGTEVAREAADMILTDDNFASIESAVEEGRGVFDTLLKFLVWTLPTNGGEGLVLLASVLFNSTLPIQPVQLLWVNMTTAIFLGMTLAFEPPEQGIMLRNPRLPNSPLFSSVLLLRIVTVSSLLCIGAFALLKYELLINGASEPQAWTVVSAVFVVGEAFYLLNCRSLTGSILSVGVFSNLWIWGGIMLMLLMQLAFTYLPFMNSLFHTEAIGLDSWLRIIMVGLLIFAIIGLQKRLSQKLAINES